MLLAYKYRIYPTKADKILLAKHFGSCRFLYNYFLAYRQNEYQKGNKVSYYMTQKELTKMKALSQYSWLNEVASQSLIMAIQQLDAAYKKFFRHQGGYPNFKSKHESTQSCSFPQNVSLEGNRVFLPKFMKNGIKVNLHRELPGGASIKQATITIEKNDIAEQDRYMGIDFNKGFVALSEVKEDGNLINTDKIYYRFKQGNKTTNDLRQLALDIAIRCKENNMSLAIENLNFGKKKSKTSKYKKDEKYNDMLHSLAYSKFDEYISRACFSNDVWLSRVNPAYTSYIGKKKYNEIKKLNTHTSASYVIARRGMRFKDAA